MDQVTKEEQDLSSAMQTQPEAAGLEEQTPTTTGQNTTHSDLTDEEKEKIWRILVQVKSVLQKSAAKARHRGGKKPQILIFYHRQKKNENKPKDNEENLEDTPDTSNSPGLPKAEDNASTASPDQELEK